MPAPTSLVELLDAVARDTSPAIRSDARRLMRGGRLTITGIERATGIAARFHDFGVVVAELRLVDGPRLASRCSCRTHVAEGRCAHAAALAQEAKADCLSPAPAKAVEALRRAVAPPSPEQLLADLTELLAPLQPESATERISWSVVPRDGGIAIEALHHGTSERFPPERLADTLAASPIAQERALLAAFTRRTPLHVKDATLAGRELAKRLRAKAPSELVARLAGHPDLKWGETLDSARVVDAPLGLAVVEQEDDVRLHAKIGPCTLAVDNFAWDETGLVAWNIQARTLYTSASGSPPPAVFTRLGREPMAVPAAMAPALVAKLTPVESTTPIELPDSMRGKQVHADGRIRVVIEPQVAAGARITLKVRPMEGAPLYVPGTGPTRMTRALGGARLQCERDLDTEREDALALAPRIGLGIAYPAWEALVDDETMLDLIQRLEGPDLRDVPVEWPAAPVRVLPALRVVRKVDVKAQGDWFGVDGTVEVDGEVLALAELFAAHQAGRRFVTLGPGRFVPIARVLDDRLENLALLTHATRDGLALSRAAIASAETLFDGLEATIPRAWRALMQRAGSVRELDVTPPAELRAELRDYQRAGYAWMRRLAEMSCGAVLADDMGLGKTVQAIAMLLQRGTQGPQLVVAPTSVGFNWARELARFAPSLRVHLLREGDRAAVLASVGPEDAVISSYGLVRSERAALTNVRWTSLVLDEAQAIKNWGTETAQTVRALSADWKLALTGTPVENHLGELFSLLQTVLPGLFASWEQFAQSYAIPVEKFGDRTRGVALARLVRPFILRRTKAEVLPELPPRSEVRVDIVLSQAERRIYDAARIDALNRIQDGGDDGRFVALAAITRLRQIASCAHLVVPDAPPTSEKLRVLHEKLDEVLGEGRTALVFSQFVRLLDVVSMGLVERGIPHLVLTGETTPSEREARVTAFQQGKSRVFLISLKAGGTGLNLTAADTVFLLDPWWNPAVEDQAADRAHRIGQQRPVTIVRLVAKDTVEDGVLALHDKKRALVAGVLSETDAAGKLSSDDLLTLLREGHELGTSSEWVGEQTRTTPPDEEPPYAISEALTRVKETWRTAFIPTTVTTYEQAVIDVVGDALHQPIRGALGSWLLAVLDRSLRERPATTARVGRVRSVALKAFVRELTRRGLVTPEETSRLKDLLRASVAVLR